MVKDILTRIENLHDFIEECMADESGVTLLDKDVILQNLREIYLLSRKIEIDDVDEDLDEGNDSIVLYDNKQSDDSEPEDDSFVESVVMPSQEEVVLDAIPTIEDFDSVAEMVVIEEPQNDIFADDPFSINDRVLLLETLFENNSDKYLEFFEKLNEFDDFDEAIIFTYDTFSDRQANEALDVIVIYLEQRLN